MVKEDLMDHAKSEVDFYALLGVAFETSESDIRRAYRKTALKYHPDKLGKDFDPEKFHLLQIANDVLGDPAAKAAYDNARNAKRQKQRQNELFEGKRRQMKDDLEARERSGAVSSTAGVKRPRQEDETEKMLRELTEKGKRRREHQEQEKLRAQQKATSMMPGAAPAAASTPTSAPLPQGEQQTAAEEAEEEDEVAALERRIAEMKAEKAKKKAEKKARKSGVFVPTDSPALNEGKWADQASATPIKHPDIFKGLKADEKPSASPKFSFSPSTPSSSNGGFAATMKRLKEQQRLADEIRKQDAEAS